MSKVAYVNVINTSKIFLTLPYYGRINSTFQV
jgi:hypothetical protein